MTVETKLDLINELIGCYYDGSYNSQEACEMLIDNIYTVLTYGDKTNAAI